MLGVERMPRPLSESRQPEGRRKNPVARGMRLRHFDSPDTFPGQPCRWGEEDAEARPALLSPAGRATVLNWKTEKGLGRGFVAEPAAPILARVGLGFRPELGPSDCSGLGIPGSWPTLSHDLRDHWCFGLGCHCAPGALQEDANPSYKGGEGEARAG